MLAPTTCMGIQPQGLGGGERGGTSDIDRDSISAVIRKRWVRLPCVQPADVAGAWVPGFALAPQYTRPRNMRRVQYRLKEWRPHSSPELQHPRQNRLWLLEHMPEGCAGNENIHEYCTWGPQLKEIFSREPSRPGMLVYIVTTCVTPQSSPKHTNIFCVCSCGPLSQAVGSA